MSAIRVADRFFSGIPHPHLLGELRPESLFIFGPYPRLHQEFKCFRSFGRTSAMNSKALSAAHGRTSQGGCR